ncbi:ATP-binding protein [Vermiphilus pyriformis]|nr:MAG: ATP-binding protein [Vermiphilus pyriformis]
MKYKIFFMIILGYVVYPSYAMEKQIRLTKDSDYYDWQLKYKFIRTIPHKLTLQLASEYLLHAPQAIKDDFECLRDINIEPDKQPQSMLILGKPGTGKTTLALSLGIALRPFAWNTYFVNCANICNEYKNSGSQNISDFVNDLTNIGTKSVVVFDEIDEIVLRNRYNTNSKEYDSDAAAAFWTAMDICEDEGNIYIIGTTNSIENFPETVLSRFDQDGIVEISSPNENSLKAYIVQYLSTTNHKCTAEDINWLAKKTKNYSLRELKHLLRKAFKIGYIKNEPINKDIFILLLASKPIFTRIYQFAKSTKPLWINFYYHNLPLVVNVVLSIWNTKQGYKLYKKQKKLAVRQTDISQSQLDLSTQTYVDTALDKKEEKYKQARRDYVDWGFRTASLLAPLILAIVFRQ